MDLVWDNNDIKGDYKCYILNFHMCFPYISHSESMGCCGEGLGIAVE